MLPADSKLKQQIISRTKLPIKIRQRKHYHLKHPTFFAPAIHLHCKSMNNEYRFSHSLILLFINIIVNCFFYAS